MAVRLGNKKGKNILKCLNKQWRNKMNQCYKPNPSNRIQEGAEEYLWKDISNRSIQDHFIAGAEWMQEMMIKKAVEWLKEEMITFSFIPYSSMISRTFCSIP